MEGGRVGGAGSEGQLWVGMGERIEGAGGGAAEDESRGLVKLHFFSFRTAGFRFPPGHWVRQ